MGNETGGFASLTSRTESLKSVDGMPMSSSAIEGEREEDEEEEEMKLFVHFWPLESSR
jgi:hypothetical protein